MNNSFDPIRLSSNHIGTERSGVQTRALRYTLITYASQGTTVVSPFGGKLQSIGCVALSLHPYRRKR